MHQLLPALDGLPGQVGAELRGLTLSGGMDSCTLVVLYSTPIAALWTCTKEVMHKEAGSQKQPCLLRKIHVFTLPHLSIGSSGK